ncbi:AAA family ATPase [Blastococcus sp. BMG 814]|uniref:AAA family ATPase n=1 Tax=Blastococcus carthaginiensis TaxID=3050034 RepID=A0ABT9IAG1_9ACTN|nr:AAA family ATPase [Blastococcus carthaginiensis]MDP5182154.1 AAA family ATPase [Blastococcus carthaginiensis]
MTAPTTIAPHNVDAERALLGILIEVPQLAESCGVRPGDLDSSRGHPELLSAIQALFEDKGTADPVLLLDELRRRDQLNRIGDGDHRGALYLHELVSAARQPGSIGHFARLVREATLRRQVQEIGAGLVRTATSQADLDVVLDNASELLVRLGLVVDEPIDGDAPIPGLGLVSDFVNEPSPPHSWVIPGVIERADRIMLIGGEGSGKSVLARQVCTLLAAGRHPFAPKVKIRPRRTLLIDLENPPDLMRRGLRGIVGQVWNEGVDVEDRFWRWNRPGGIDLRAPADRALLAQAIEKTRPDLVAIGPAYKAFRPRSGDTHESGPADFGAAIDHLRERYGCAFWIEHHTPKGDGAGGSRRGDPIGSSYWLRWPEFGLTLRQPRDERGHLTAEPNVYVLQRFRGDRESRSWPDRLIKGASQYPWTADYDPENRANLFDAVEEDNALALDIL